MNYLLKTVDAVLSPATSVKVITIPRNAKVELTGIVDGKYSEVKYYDKRGFVLSDLIEKNEWEESVVSIPNGIQQKNVNLPTQYITVDGIVKHNLCGEFCTAYVAGLSIDSVLNTLKEKSLPYYNMFVKKDLPMGIDSLETMLKIFSINYERWTSVFSDARYGTIISPKILGRKLGKAKAIIGVKVDGTGRLNVNGYTGHWVVLTDCVHTHGCEDGVCDIYNPFWNRFETYSYQELMTSAKRFGALTATFVESSF